MTAGDIYTIAGGGFEGFSGDGGPAIQAEVNGVSEVVVDSTGNVVLADQGNSIRRDSLQDRDVLRSADDGRGHLHRGRWWHQAG